MSYRHYRRLICRFIASCLVLSCCTQHAGAQGLSLEWARSLQGKGDNNPGNGIAFDTAGNVYVAGVFTDTLDCDPGPGVALLIPATLSSQAPAFIRNVFIAKYTAAGNYVWSRQISGNDVDFWGWPRGLTVDAKGNVIVTGSLSDSADFDPGPGSAIRHSAGDRDIFLAKYDKDGNYLWAQSMGGTQGDWASSVASDTAGNVFISGAFGGVCDFEPGAGVTALTATGFQDNFVAKYAVNGNLLWARRMGSINGTGNSNGIAVDIQGNVYTTGAFENTATFSETNFTLTSYGDWDAYLLKHSADGSFVWAKNIGSPGGVDYGYDVATDKHGNVYACGYFQSAADFDPGPGTALLNASALYTAYLAKYNTDGDYQWALGVGDGYMNMFQSVSTDGIGNVYTCGFFMGSPDFDPGAGVASLTASGLNACIARYNAENGHYLWAGTLESASDNNAASLVTDISGTTYVTGSFTALTDMDPGASSDMHTPMGNSDLYLLKLRCPDPSSSQVNVIACESPYSLNGTVYAQSGTYVQHFASASRCDSSVTIHLTIAPLAAPVITVNGFVLGTTQSYSAYQWMMNGNPIPGATGPTLVVSLNGDYQVSVTDAKGCSATSPVYTVTNATAIADPSDAGQSIRIYPNPTNDRIFIYSPVPVNASISSIDGKQLIHETDVKSMSLKTLEPGIYIIHLTDRRNRTLRHEKIVKK